MFSASLEPRTETLKKRPILSPSKPVQWIVTFDNRKAIVHRIIPEQESPTPVFEMSWEGKADSKNNENFIRCLAERIERGHRHKYFQELVVIAEIAGMKLLKKYILNDACPRYSSISEFFITPSVVSLVALA